MPGNHVRPARYRLSVHPTLAPWQPEVQHALLFVERQFHLERSTSADPNIPILHYGAQPTKGARSILACFFSEATNLADNGIHLNQKSLLKIESRSVGVQLLPSPMEMEGVLPYDALGLIFLLVSRLEERGEGELDLYDRFPAHKSFLARHGGFLRPLADIAAADIAALISSPEPPVPRSNYNVCLTHDVDRLRGYHRRHEPLRQAVSDILIRRQPGHALASLGRAYMGGEPWRSFRRIMLEAEKRGLQGRFYFMGPSDAPEDSPYALRDAKLLRRVSGEIRQRGHIIGFHPGAKTAGDAQCWQFQRCRLEEILGVRLEEGRQHQLRFIAEQTWDIWENAGMVMSATLAYPEMPGFRAGTCHAFRAYSLRGRRSLNLIERPTQITDFGLFGDKYLNFDLRTALDVCEKVITTVRGHRGDLTLLYHTGSKSLVEQKFLSKLLELA